MASVVASLAIIPTLPLAPITFSTPSGRTRTTFRTWFGGTVSSSCRRRFTSKTSSQEAGISETCLEELFNEGPPSGGPSRIAGQPSSVRLATSCARIIVWFLTVRHAVFPFKVWTLARDTTTVHSSLKPDRARGHEHRHGRPLTFVAAGIVLASYTRFY